MSNKLMLNIITPSNVVYNSTIDYVLVNTFKGKMVLNKDYASTMGVINQGTIEIVENNTSRVKKIISDGVFVIADNELKILTDYYFDDNQENQKIIDDLKITALNNLNSSLKKSFMSKEELYFFNIKKMLKK